MTPAPVAEFMASMFAPTTRAVRLLDAGAGAGALTAAFVARACARKRRPASVLATCYEVDPLLLTSLRRTLRSCEGQGRRVGFGVRSEVVARDFLADAAELLDACRDGVGARPRFTAAILNPPYRKIHSASRERSLLRRAGIETGNLYTAFVALAIRLLEPGGELVAITPRSFCNGPYFQPFRQLLLGAMSLLQVHVFQSRSSAFRDEGVLQENVIFRARKGAPRGRITLSSSAGPGAHISKRSVAHDLVVHPEDPNSFIRLALSDEDAAIADRMRRMPCSLAGLGIEVSTGRVVDFRVREHLRAEIGPETVPLIYAKHFAGGFVRWPGRDCRKPNALADMAATQPLLTANETYVLTKRFTSKEQRRRVVAAVYDPARLPRHIARVGIENHVNYFHALGSGLPKALARGLAAYLNSTLVDRFFRQFNGHTQVNAVDLRSLRYPGRASLVAIGREIGAVFPSQDDIDAIVERICARSA